MSKNDSWVYFVSIDEQGDPGCFDVAKAHLGSGEVAERYKVTVPDDMDADDIDFLQDEDVNCSCMGFRMQKKYPLIEHKHVLLVLAHIRIEVNAELSGESGSSGRFMLNAKNKPYMLD